MIRGSKLLTACLVAVLFYLPLARGQEAMEDETYLLWFDHLVGIENTGLYDGVVYKEKYRTINEKSKFFKSPDFLPGSVSYNGQEYFDLKLKYDVFEDKLLLKLEDRLGGSTLELFKEKVTSFTIDGHQFIKIETLTAEGNISGFYEVSRKSSYFTLFTKHLKKDFSRKDRRTLYYEFVDLKKKHLLHYKGRYQWLRNKKDVTTLFPDLKKEIDSFYNQARRLRKSKPDEFIHALINRLETLMPQGNKITAE